MRRGAAHSGSLPLGGLLSVLAALLGGAGSILTKLAYAEGFEPLSPLAIRFGLAAAILAPLGMVLWREQLALPRHSLLPLVATAGANLLAALFFVNALKVLLSTVLARLSFFAGLKLIGSVNSALLGVVEPPASIPLAIMGPGRAAGAGPAAGSGPDRRLDRPQPARPASPGTPGLPGRLSAVGVPGRLKAPATSNRSVPGTGQKSSRLGWADGGQ